MFLIPTEYPQDSRLERPSEVGGAEKDWTSKRQGVEVSRRNVLSGLELQLFGPLESYGG